MQHKTPFFIDPDNLQTPEQLKAYLFYIKQFSKTDKDNHNQESFSATANTNYWIEINGQITEIAFPKTISGKKVIRKPLSSLNKMELEKLSQSMAQCHSHYIDQENEACFEYRDRIIIVSHPSRIELLNPCQLTADETTKAVLNAMLEQNRNQPFLVAGSKFIYQERTYLLTHDIEWVKQNRYMILGRLLGLGGQGEVRKVADIIRREQGDLSLRSASTKPKKAVALVAKRGLLSENKTSDSMNESLKLKQAGFHVKPVSKRKSGEITYSILLMEEVQGKDLFDFLYKEKNKTLTKRNLSWQEAIRLCEAIPVAYMSQVATAGIIHRDLKPENIKIEPQRDPNHLPAIKIIDFGFATDTQMPVYSTPGTLAYISPEAFDKNAVLDEKADVYALGIIYWQIFAKRNEFRLRQKIEDANRHIGFSDFKDTEIMQAKQSRDPKMHCFYDFGNLSDQDAFLLPPSDEQQEEIKAFITSMISPLPDDRPRMDEVYEFFKTKRVALTPVRKEQEKDKEREIEQHAGKKNTVFSATSKQENKIDQIKAWENKCAIDLLKRALNLNNKVHQFYGIGGSEVIIENESHPEFNGHYTLAKGVAEIVQLLLCYLNTELPFDQMINKIIDQAQKGINRSEGAALFKSHTHPEVYEFYLHITSYIESEVQFHKNRFDKENKFTSALTKDMHDCIDNLEKAINPDAENTPNKKT